MQLNSRALPRTLKTQWFVIILSMTLMCFYSSSTYSSEESSGDLNAQKQQLQELLDKIENAREQRAEQKATLEKLNKKMQCNWDLIQDYDACFKKYAEQKQEKLECAQKAKDRAKECLSEINE